MGTTQGLPDGRSVSRRRGRRSACLQLERALVVSGAHLSDVHLDGVPHRVVVVEAHLAGRAGQRGRHDG